MSVERCRVSTINKIIKIVFYVYSSCEHCRIGNTRFVLRPAPEKKKKTEKNSNAFCQRRFERVREIPLKYFRTQPNVKIYEIVLKPYLRVLLPRRAHVEFAIKIIKITPPGNRSPYP